jgi:hypothetical protein
MIFSEGSGSLVIPDWQRLATHKILKNRKNTKKSVIFFRAEGHFSAKTA